ncbi:MAG: hypothetical protein IPL87_00925 [Candidatus Moraniibacteriota bacterium]|nr:MAG: hypothetical protein IPL87_00925 [Candidatus Moranbacteria bacterium]
MKKYLFVFLVSLCAGAFFSPEALFAQKKDPCGAGGAGTCQTPVNGSQCPQGSYLGWSPSCSSPTICCASSGGTGTQVTGCPMLNPARCQTTPCPDKTFNNAACASQCSAGTYYCEPVIDVTGSVTTVKCDPTKFKEYAGVCFPLKETTGLSETSVAEIVVNLMRWMLFLFGFLAIIAFIISGIQYLTSAGNMNTIETAKRNMKYSIIGVIVALAGLVIIVAIDALLRGTAWGGGGAVTF